MLSLTATRACMIGTYWNLITCTRDANYAALSRRRAGTSDITLEPSMAHVLDRQIGFRRPTTVFAAITVRRVSLAFVGTGCCCVLRRH